MNSKCTATICSKCTAREVIRILTSSCRFEPQSSFKCPACQVVDAFVLQLGMPSDETRRMALYASLETRINHLLKEINGMLVPLMSSLCMFRAELNGNYEDDGGNPQDFSVREIEVVLDYLNLFRQYSGQLVDNNRVKVFLKEISFSIKWLLSTFGIGLHEELDKWTIANNQYDGWFAFMIEFGMKTYKRMMKLRDQTNIQDLPFWAGIYMIARAEEIVVVE